jgi:hypothetical protein
MLGYLYCIRKQELNQIIISLVEKYFYRDSLKIDADKGREIVYTNSYESFYSNRFVAKEAFFSLYNRFKRNSFIILPVKCYEVYNYHCTLVEQININLTKSNNLNFKVWRR